MLQTGRRRYLSRQDKRISPLTHFLLPLFHPNYFLAPVCAALYWLYAELLGVPIAVGILTADVVPTD